MSLTTASPRAGYNGSEFTTTAAKRVLEEQQIRCRDYKEKDGGGVGGTLRPLRLRYALSYTRRGTRLLTRREKEAGRNWASSSVLTATRLSRPGGHCQLHLLFPAVPVAHTALRTKKYKNKLTPSPSAKSKRKAAHTHAKKFSDSRAASCASLQSRRPRNVHHHLHRKSRQSC